MDINIPESEIDGVMKILVLGNSNVGKTSLLSQYVHHDYNTVYGVTSITRIDGTFSIGKSSISRFSLPKPLLFYTYHEYST